MLFKMPRRAVEAFSTISLKILWRSRTREVYDSNSKYLESRNICWENWKSIQYLIWQKFNMLSIVDGRMKKVQSESFNKNQIHVFLLRTFFKQLNLAETQQERLELKIEMKNWNTELENEYRSQIVLFAVFFSPSTYNMQSKRRGVVREKQHKNSQTIGNWRWRASSFDQLSFLFSSQFFKCLPSVVDVPLNYKHQTHCSAGRPRTSRMWRRRRRRKSWIQIFCVPRRDLVRKKNKKCSQNINLPWLW